MVTLFEARRMNLSEREEDSKLKANRNRMSPRLSVPSQFV